MILERFVNSSVIQENSSTFKLLNLELEEKNLKPLENIDVGLGAKAILRKLKTTEKPEERTFRSHVRSMLIGLVNTIFERSPLKYKMTRAISSLSPTEMLSITI